MSLENLVLYEVPRAGIARLTMNRPEARNAQNLDFLYSLDDQFTRAMRDTEIKVIVLAANGPDFSAGHDLRHLLDKEDGERFGERSAAGNFTAPHNEGYMAREEEAYVQLCWRWRNLTKPTIAQVHGRCIAAGLMLAWVCDLIVASEDATFYDPTPQWGSNGLEWHAYTWEFGARKAKEFLFTCDTWNAREAWRLGMVNHVVPADQLAGFTENLAERIAAKPSFALKAAKQSVNAALDAQGQKSAMDTAFQIHHLTHYHNLVKYDGEAADPAKMPGMYTGAKKKKD